jgi:hypothetical protein
VCGTRQQYVNSRAVDLTTPVTKNELVCHLHTYTICIHAHEDANTEEDIYLSSMECTPFCRGIYPSSNSFRREENSAPSAVLSLHENIQVKREESSILNTLSFVGDAVL